MPRPARVSPDRILAAAAVESAGRGFGGARVDRIARRARVNKAMLYYHFTSKQDLYRTLLRRMFTLAGDRMRAIATGGGTPGEKVDRVIAGFAGLIREHAHFPAIMLPLPARSRRLHEDAEIMTLHVQIPRAPQVVLAALASAALCACAAKPPADRVRASGQVEATDVQVAAQVGGRLLELRVTEGDRVAAGR